MGYPFEDKSKAIAGGLKSKRGPAKLTKVVRDMAKPERIEEAFQILESMAIDDRDFNALKLYLAYVLGMPTVTIEQSNTGEIVIIRNGNSYPQIRTASGTTEDSGESTEV